MPKQNSSAADAQIRQKIEEQKRKIQLFKKAGRVLNELVEEDKKKEEASELTSLEKQIQTS